MSTTEILAQLRQVSPGGAPRGCTILLRNTTTPEREATIVAAGVHFFYSDAQGQPAGDYLAGPVRVDVASGASASFKSSDPRKSVTKIVAAVRVRFGEKDDPTSKTFDFASEVNAPVITTSPPRRFVFVNEEFDFKVCSTAPFAAADPSVWCELVESSKR